MRSIVRTEPHYVAMAQKHNKERLNKRGGIADIAGLTQTLRVRP